MLLICLTFLNLISSVGVVGAISDLAQISLGQYTWDTVSDGHLPLSDSEQIHGILKEYRA